MRKYYIFICCLSLFIACSDNPVWATPASNVQATDGTSPNHVDITWTRNGAPAGAQFRVMRRIRTNSASCADFAGIADTTATTFRDVNADSGTDYEYAVYYSPGLDCTAKDVGYRAIVAPSNLRVETRFSIYDWYLAWDAPSTSSSGVDFRIVRATQSSDLCVSGQPYYSSVPSHAINYTFGDQNAYPNTTYYYAIYSQGRHHRSSQCGNVVSKNTPLIPNHRLIEGTFRNLAGSPLAAVPVRARIGNGLPIDRYTDTAGFYFLQAHSYDPVTVSALEDSEYFSPPACQHFWPRKQLVPASGDPPQDASNVNFQLRHTFCGREVVQQGLTLRFSWIPSPAWPSSSRYIVTRRHVEGMQDITHTFPAISGTSLIDTQVSSGLGYAYQVIREGEPSSISDESYGSLPLNSANSVSATYNTSFSAISISWNAHNTPDTEYEIRRNTNPNAVCTGIVVGRTTNHSFSDYSPQPLVTYYYRVIPTSAELSLQCSEAQQVTGRRLRVSTPSTGNASDGDPASVTVTWYSPDPVTSEINFDIYRSTDSNTVCSTPANKVGTVSGGLPMPLSRTFVDTTAVPGIRYFYSVLARAGNFSTSCTPPYMGHRGLQMPSLTSASTNLVNGVQLTWQGNNPTGTHYSVFRSTSNQACLAGGRIAERIESTSYLDTSAMPGILYYYSVLADEDFDSACSNVLAGQRSVQASSSSSLSSSAGASSPVSTSSSSSLSSSSTISPSSAGSTMSTSSSSGPHDSSVGSSGSSQGSSSSEPSSSNSSHDGQSSLASGDSSQSSDLNRDSPNTPIEALEPIVECIQNEGLVTVAHFGYRNASGYTLVMESGPHNFIHPHGNLQVSQFNPGRHFDQMSVSASSSSDISWALNGVVAQANVQSPQCCRTQSCRSCRFANLESTRRKIAAELKFLKSEIKIIVSHKRYKKQKRIRRAAEAAVKSLNQISKSLRRIPKVALFECLDSLCRPIKLDAKRNIDQAIGKLKSKLDIIVTVLRVLSGRALDLPTIRTMQHLKLSEIANEIPAVVMRCR